jgi:predicted nucleic acid-binding protein
MILDTSVLYDSLVSAPLSHQARGLISSDHRLRAPDLIHVEIAGAITHAVRRKDITIRQAKAILKGVPQLAPEVAPSTDFVVRAFALSLELAHPLADCVFLAQAEAEDDVLVTSDDRFVRKLAATPYASRAVSLADWNP